MAKKVCSFCGRSEKDVNFIITGLNGFICDQCAQQAYQIVVEAGLGPDGDKMSKSKGNVVDPNDVVDEYGADVPLGCRVQPL